MTPQDIILEARKRGLRLEPAGDKLAVMPKGACPADFASLLLRHKPELLEWLSSPHCPGWEALPPVNLALKLAMPQPTPHDRERVISYLLRQTGDCPGPLSAWLVRRENSYFDGPGREWPCGVLCYAAARDAACWQLSRSEDQLLEFLAAPAN